MAEMGLLQFKSAAQLKAEQDAADAETAAARRRDQVESNLAAHIRKAFESAKTAKREIEGRLLDCARRQKGEYDAQKLAAIRESGGSEVYPKLTTTKCRAGAAWIRDILMPVTGRPWGLDPTPISDIPDELLSQFEQALQQRMAAEAQQDEQGPGQGDPQLFSREQMKAKLREMIQQKAKEACEAHEALIADQLAEGGWEEALEGFVDDFVTYPAAILKGPILQKVTRLGWGPDWQVEKVEEVQPMFFRVSPFDVYPSPDSADVNSGSSLIERIRFTRAELNKFRGVPGYNDQALMEVLREHGTGGLREWLATDAERARLEDRPHEWMLGGETIEALQYWGGAQGLMLLQWGVTPDLVPDALAEYEIDAVLIGRHVIRCVINRNPLGGRPYNKASFQNVPGSFWGRSVPELMEDVQDMCCAAARAQANNMAFASGPQVEVDEDRLQPGENPNEMFPLKRWRVKSGQTPGAGGGAVAPVIRFYQPASMAGELMGVYDAWEKRADDATNIPRYIYGSEKVGGAGNTASGLSMLMESANKGIKDAIRHIDRGVVRPVVGALWLHNMQYSDDESIKGDYNVVARGANAMLQREQTLQARQQFLAGTNNPIDMQIIGMEGRAKLLRKVAESLDMPDLIPTPEELKARTEQQQKQQAEQQAAVAQAEQQQAQAETQRTLSQSTESEAKAAKTMAEAQRLGLENGAAVAQLAHAGGQTLETLGTATASPGEPGQQPGLPTGAGPDSDGPGGVAPGAGDGGGAAATPPQPGEGGGLL